MEIHEKMQSTDSNTYIEWEEDVEFAQKLPKIELHLHLDGSLSPEFIEEEAVKLDIKLPVTNLKENLRNWLQEQKLSALAKIQTERRKGKIGGYLTSATNSYKLKNN